MLSREVKDGLDEAEVRGEETHWQGLAMQSWREMMGAWSHVIDSGDEKQEEVLQVLFLGLK